MGKTVISSLMMKRRPTGAQDEPGAKPIAAFDMLHMMMNIPPAGPQFQNLGARATKDHKSLRISTPGPHSIVPPQLMYPPSPPGPPPSPAVVRRQQLQQAIGTPRSATPTGNILTPTSPRSPETNSPLLTPTPPSTGPFSLYQSPTPGTGTISRGSGAQLGPYVVERTLGQGSYGKVKLAYHSITNERVAMKFIHKASIKKETHLVRIRREVRILRLLSHPNIIRLHHVVETESDIILVMEHASGGELLDYVQARGRLSEQQARSLFRQILSAVTHLHKYCILHRDLKPQNLLLVPNNCSDLPTIKLVDFGFANLFDPKNLLGTFCGSPYYASPEMVSGTKYTGPEVDIWSLGVILYSMLVGSVPFNDEHVKGLYSKILAGRYDMPAYLSSSARDLIASMLVVDKRHRISMSKVLEHPWMRIDDQDLHSRRSSPAPALDLIPHANRPVSHAAQLDQKTLAKLADYQIQLDIYQAAQTIIKDPYGKIACLYWLLFEKKEQDMQASLQRQAQVMGQNPGLRAPGVPSTQSSNSSTTWPPLVTSNGFVIPDRILSIDETETWDELMKDALLRGPPLSVHVPSPISSPNNVISPFSIATILDQPLTPNRLAQEDPYIRAAINYSKSNTARRQTTASNGWTGWLIGKFGGPTTQGARRERIYPVSSATEAPRDPQEDRRLWTEAHE